MVQILTQALLPPGPFSSLLFSLGLQSEFLDFHWPLLSHALPPLNPQTSAQLQAVGIWSPLQSLLNPVGSQLL